MTPFGLGLKFFVSTVAQDRHGCDSQAIEARIDCSKFYNSCRHKLTISNKYPIWQFFASHKVENSQSPSINHVKTQMTHDSWTWMWFTVHDSRVDSDHVLNHRPLTSDCPNDHGLWEGVPIPHRATMTFSSRVCWCFLWVVPGIQCVR
jgi:hypothetical protein